MQRAKELVTEKLSRGYHVKTTTAEEIRTVDLPEVQPTVAAVPLEDTHSTWTCDYVNEENAVRVAKTEIREKNFFEKKAEIARKKALMASQIIDLEEEETVSPNTPPRVVQIEENTGKGRKRRKGKTPKKRKETEKSSSDMPRNLGEARLENLSDVLEGKAANLPIPINDLTDIIEPEPSFPPEEPLPKPAKRVKLVAFEGDSDVPEFIDLLLAHSWDVTQDPTGWIMSEKLDGVRCYWNGKQLVSRQGHPYASPAFFTYGFPTDTSLDGELWVGRKQFQRCVSVVRRSDAEKHDFEEWKVVKYLLFDAPSVQKPFEDRLKYIEDLAKSVDSPYLIAHKHTVCKGVDHLQSELQRINDLGGEGLMLRQPGSLYEYKRSKTLLKVKSFKDDEAVVVAHEPGHGKNEGQLGALRVRTADGREFKVGTGFTDADRRNPPAVGTRITYKYQELTVAGIPRFPSFLREHPEL